MGDEIDDIRDDLWALKKEVEEIRGILIVDATPARHRKDQHTNDHERGCEGRSYTCTCGYDAERDAVLTALREENKGWQQNMRDQFDALCAMRNDLNEMLTIPSLESDLRHGPETSVFCSVVVEAVRNKLTAAETEAATLRKLLEEAGEALEPFASHLDAMKFDLDNLGNEMPDDQVVGWVYVTNGHFRAARAVCTRIKEMTGE